MRTLLTSLLILLHLLPPPAASTERPSLVVVVSLDQFRQEYLTRFAGHFGDGGFRRLLSRGAIFTNAEFDHSLTMTGPGHAVLLTGTYGNVNGITANSWWDAAARREVYCVADPAVTLVGAAGNGSSPANLTTSTLGDELRLASGFRSRVVSVSNKDRAAVLMGGKLPSGVFWMAESTFTTSTYYATSLPGWVREFNSSGVINGYFGRVWDRALPEEAYAGCDRDDAPYEGSGAGLGRAFPHPVTGEDRTRITPSYYSALLTSPFGSEALAAFARAAVRGEQLGKRGVTDILCVGFSSNDYVGHTYGPNSHEVLDMTVRTDRILADFFDFLDEEVGLRNCLIVLTSDHGVAPIPEYVTANVAGTDAGRVMVEPAKAMIEASLSRRFGPPARAKWIEAVSNNSIHLNRDALRERGVDAATASQALADTLRRWQTMAAVFTNAQMASLSPSSTIERRMKRSYHPLRTGDVFYALKPYWIEGYGTTGTSHGEPHAYDAHVPVIFVGRAFRPGTYRAAASPADIGPTLAAVLGLAFPPGRDGRVLSEALR